MDFVDQLKELRLLKGQEGYRYCLAWVAVLTRPLAKPLATVAVTWLCIKNGIGTRLFDVLDAALQFFRSTST